MKNFYLHISKIMETTWQHFASAGMIGLFCGFYSYSFFFQTTVFSKKYLLFACTVMVIGFIFGYIALHGHPFARKNHFFLNKKSILIALALFGLALPSLYFVPPYPILPLFQHKSTLIIEIKTNNKHLKSSQLKKTWLNTGVDPAGFKKFTFSEDWGMLGEEFILPANSIGKLEWQGYVGHRATLALPIPLEDLEIKTIWDGEIRQVPTSGLCPFQVE